jgi:hypothetical protein
VSRSTTSISARCEHAEDPAQEISVSKHWIQSAKRSAVKVPAATAILQPLPLDPGSRNAEIYTFGGKLSMTFGASVPASIDF